MPSSRRPDIWFRDVPAERLCEDLTKLCEVAGEREMCNDFRMFVVRDEAGRRDVSLQRLMFLLFGPKTESFEAVYTAALLAPPRGFSVVRQRYRKDTVD